MMSWKKCRQCLFVVFCFVWMAGWLAGSMSSIIKLWLDIRRIIGHKSNLPIPRVSPCRMTLQTPSQTPSPPIYVDGTQPFPLWLSPPIWWTLWRLCLGKQLDNWCICCCCCCSVLAVCLHLNLRLYCHIATLTPQNLKRAVPWSGFWNRCWKCCCLHVAERLLHLMWLCCQGQWPLQLKHFVGLFWDDCFICFYSRTEFKWPSIF